MHKRLAAAAILAVFALFPRSTLGEDLPKSEPAKASDAAAPHFSPGKSADGVRPPSDRTPVEGKSNTTLAVNVDANRKVENEVVARSETTLTPSSIEPVTVNHAEIEDVAGARNPQTSSTSTQTPPAHHSHHVRNFIIFAVALSAGLLLLTVVAGKS